MQQFYVRNCTIQLNPKHVVFLLQRILTGLLEGIRIVLPPRPRRVTVSRSTDHGYVGSIYQDVNVTYEYFWCNRVLSDIQRNRIGVSWSLA